MFSQKGEVLVFLVLLVFSSPVDGSSNKTSLKYNPSDLVNYLWSITGKHTISGQFIEFGPLDPIQDIYDQTGKWLGLIGGDYWWYGETDWYGDLSFNNYAIPYWQQGGLITISCSMPNPSTGGPLYDTSYLNVKDLFTAGTSTNNNFMTLLNTVATGLKQLQQAGVVVIWRPFHEMQGDWFWWGTTLLSDSDFISMYQYTHDYMTNNMGLNNIVWLWAGSDYFNRYPGDAYVDIVGQDLYTSYPSQGQGVYNNQRNVGKLIVLAEFGPGSPQQGDTSFDETTLISSIQNTMPNNVFWQQWWDGNGGNVGWGMAECQNVNAALWNPWVLNRGDLWQFFEGHFSSNQTL